MAPTRVRLLYSFSAKAMKDSFLRFHLIAWVAACTLSLWPAIADDSAACSDRTVNAAQRIAACAALIASGTLDDRDGSKALRNRAAAYVEVKDIDHALADYDDAIRL